VWVMLDCVKTELHYTCSLDEMKRSLFRSVGPVVMLLFGAISTSHWDQAVGPMKSMWSHRERFKKMLRGASACSTAAVQAVDGFSVVERSPAALKSAHNGRPGSEGRAATGRRDLVARLSASAQEGPADFAAGELSDPRPVHHPCTGGPQLILIIRGRALNNCVASRGLVLS